MKLFNICLLLIIGTLGCQSQTAQTVLKTGNLAKIKSFLKENADINAHYDGYTLLCGAVKLNKKKIVNYLIENEADLNKMSNDKTPLMYAAKYGRLEIAQLLIQKGVDKTVENPKGRTALDYAYKYKQSALVTFLSE